MRRSLSSNAFSVDLQVKDVVGYLTVTQRSQLLRAFPELQEALNTITGESSWVDCEALGLDPEYMSWVVDWIEEITGVYWEDGEPWTGDDDPEDGEGDGPDIANTPNNPGTMTAPMVRDADPDLERLLDEEEAIERRAREQHNRPIIANHDTNTNPSNRRETTMNMIQRRVLHVLSSDDLPFSRERHMALEIVLRDDVPNQAIPGLRFMNTSTMVNSIEFAQAWIDHWLDGNQFCNGGIHEVVDMLEIGALRGVPAPPPEPATKTVRILMDVVVEEPTVSSNPTYEERVSVNLFRDIYNGDRVAATVRNLIPAGQHRSVSLDGWYQIKEVRILDQIGHGLDTMDVATRLRR